MNSSNPNSIINLGDISQPAVVLIEKISDAIGAYFKPYQIRQVARAEADAEKIRTISQIEIANLQQRALYRFAFEEAKKQENIESITYKSLPYIREDANPNNIEDDWITNFFDKCRIISDEQMQALWSKLLAGEANSPGSYSKRTINLLSSLDKSDALLFKNLCGFGWFLGEVNPLIYDTKNPIYTKYGIDFSALEHLDDIGLVNFNSIGYKKMGFSKHVCISYYGIPVEIEFNSEDDNELETGMVFLTRAGQELAPICDSKPVPGFLDYILSKWRGKQLVVSSPYPRNLPVIENN